jgi:hypothetical protein
MPRYGSNPARGLGLRDCVVCGTQFQPYRVKTWTCSRKCYRQTSAWKEAAQRSDSRPERKERKNELRRGGSLRQQATVRAYNRKTQLERSGWTVEAYQEAHDRQDGLCAICGRPYGGGARAASRLHADHDHKTGKRRGLLCNNCNRGIGYFEDDPALLAAAIEYVERYRAVTA